MSEFREELRDILRNYKIDEDLNCTVRLIEELVFKFKEELM